MARRVLFTLIRCLNTLTASFSLKRNVTAKKYQ